MAHPTLQTQRAQPGLDQQRLARVPQRVRNWALAPAARLLHVVRSGYVLQHITPSDDEGQPRAHSQVLAVTRRLLLAVTSRFSIAGPDATTRNALLRISKFACLRQRLKKVSGERAKGSIDIFARRRPLFLSIDHASISNMLNRLDDLSDQLGDLMTRAKRQARQSSHRLELSDRCLDGGTHATLAGRQYVPGLDARLGTELDVSGNTPVCLVMPAQNSSFCLLKPPCDVYGGLPSSLDLKAASCQPKRAVTRPKRDNDCRCGRCGGQDIDHERFIRHRPNVRRPAVIRRRGWRIALP